MRKSYKNLSAILRDLWGSYCKNKMLYGIRTRRPPGALLGPTWEARKPNMLTVPAPYYLFYYILFIWGDDSNLWRKSNDTGRYRYRFYLYYNMSSEGIISIIMQKMIFFVCFYKEYLQEFNLIRNDSIESNMYLIWNMAQIKVTYLKVHSIGSRNVMRYGFLAVHVFDR